MKRIFSINKQKGNATAFVAIAALLFSSCKKDYTDITEIQNQDLSQKSFVKVISASTGATRNYAYLQTAYGAVPLSGNAFAYLGTWPASNSYFSTDQGQNTVLIRDTLGTSTQVPINTVATLEAGKYYSLFTYDSIISIKTKIVADNIVVPTDTSARIRFANFVRSAAAIPNVDVFSKNLNANVYTNVAVTDVTPFVPYASNVSDSFFVRATGTAVNLNTLVFTPTAKRSYTILFRGRYDLPSAAGVPRGITLINNY